MQAIIFFKRQNILLLFLYPNLCLLWYQNNANIFLFSIQFMFVNLQKIHRTLNLLHFIYHPSAKKVYVPSNLCSTCRLSNIKSKISWCQYRGCKQHTKKRFGKRIEKLMGVIVFWPRAKRILPFTFTTALYMNEYRVEKKAFWRR